MAVDLKTFMSQGQKSPGIDASASSNKHLRERCQRRKGCPSQRQDNPSDSMLAELQVSARLKHPFLSPGRRKEEGKIYAEGQCHTHLVPKDAPDTCLRCSYSRGWTPDVNDAQSKQSARAKAATAVPKKSCMHARTASTYMLKMNR